MRMFFGLVALALLGFSSAAAGAATSAGGVYIVTLPNGADVWVDGVYCGRSPVLVDALTEGRHVLTLTKTGWNVREAQVDVPSGSVALWSTKLSAGARGASEKGRGSVTMRGLRKEASVSVDGAPVRDSRKPLSLPEGPHSVSFLGARGVVTRSFSVLPDMSSELVLRGDGAAPPSPGRVGVIVPAGDYLPQDAIVERDQVLSIRYRGHQVIAHLNRVWMRVDGKVVSYDSAPVRINGKFYLPLDLLDFLTK
jgi:hypothetical protein